MRTVHRTAAVGLAMALALAACSGDPDDTGTDAASPTAEATTGTEDETTDDATAGGGGSEDDGSSASTSDGAFEPVSVDVDEVFRDNGIEVTLDGVDVQPDGLFFRISAFNSTDQTAQLAVDPSLVYATDERGERLSFQPPSDNPTLSFEPGETLEARLAFAANYQEVPRVVAVWFNYQDDTVPAEQREGITVVSAHFNNLFLREAGA